MLRESNVTMHVKCQEGQLWWVLSIYYSSVMIMKDIGNIDT